MGTKSLKDDSDDIIPYAFDLFISYAHKEKNWVHSFIKDLRQDLSDQSGREIRAYISAPRQEVLTEREIEKFIFRALEESKVLIVIISSFYAKREWFHREIAEFIKLSHKKGGWIINNRSRIFMVWRNDIPLEDLPEELRNFVGYRIDASDPSAIDIADIDELIEYKTILKDLVRDVANSLKQV